MKILKYSIPTILVGLLVAFFAHAQVSNPNFWKLQSNRLSPISNNWSILFPSQSSDPSGTNGLMIYNTNTNSFRCYENGAWKNCDTTGGSGAVANGINGYVTRYTGTSTISTGILLDNATVAGANATSSTVTFNIQGTTTLDPFNVASATGTSVLRVTAHNRVGINTTTPANTLTVVGNAGAANPFLVASSSSAALLTVSPAGNLSVAGTGSFTGAIDSPTLDTGQGANELYDMDQNVLTSSNVQFANILLQEATTTGITNLASTTLTRLTVRGDIVMGGDTVSDFVGTNMEVSSGALRVSLTPTFTTLNTGQGAYELYAMDQDVLTTSNVIFGAATTTGITKLATTTIVGSTTITSLSAANCDVKSISGALVCGTDATGAGGGATTTITADVETTGPAFTFATTTANNIALHINGSGSTLTFNPQVVSGFTIPSTTLLSNLSGFYDTPSTRITAGSYLSWSSNTLNASSSPYYTNLNASGLTRLANSSTTHLTVTGTLFDTLGSAGTYGQFLRTTGTTTLWTTVSASPGGSDTQIQYNNDGSFGGISSFTWNGTTLANTASTTLASTTITGAINLQGNPNVAGALTATKITVTNASTTNMTLSGAFYDGSNLIGSLGMVLMSTATSTNWVATSTLGISGSLSGGTNGFAARWTSASALTAGKLIDNGTVLGVNATSSTVALNLQAGATLDPFNVASSSGTSVFVIKENGNVGIGTSSPQKLLHVWGNQSLGVMRVTRDAGNTIAPNQQYVTYDINAHTASSTVTTFPDLAGTSLTFSISTSTNIASPNQIGVISGVRDGNDQQGKMIIGAYRGSTVPVASSLVVSGNTLTGGMGTTTPQAVWTVQGNTTFPTAPLLTLASSTGTSIFQVTADAQVLACATCRLTVPQGTAPTITAVGDVGVDTSNGGLFVFHGGGAVETVSGTTTKGMLLENPTASENLSPFFVADQPVTITRIECHIQSTVSNTPSWTFSLPHGTNKNSGFANTFTAGQACTSTTTRQTLTLNGDLTLAAGEMIWATSSAVSNASSTMFQIYYKYDR